MNDLLELLQNLQFPKIDPRIVIISRKTSKPDEFSYQLELDFGQYSSVGTK